MSVRGAALLTVRWGSVMASTKLQDSEVQDRTVSVLPSRKSRVMEASYVRQNLPMSCEERRRRCCHAGPTGTAGTHGKGSGWQGTADAAVSSCLVAASLHTGSWGSRHQGPGPRAAHGPRVQTAHVTSRPACNSLKPLEGGGAGSRPPAVFGGCRNTRWRDWGCRAEGGSRAPPDWRGVRGRNSRGTHRSGGAQAGGPFGTLSSSR